MTIEFSAPVVVRTVPSATIVPSGLYKNPTPLGSGFNGYTVFDKNNVIRCGERITHLHYYCETSGYVRPQIARHPNAANGSNFYIVYEHPAQVWHPGGGWCAFQLIPAIVLNYGVHYAGAYFSGFDNSPMTHIAYGRAECAGSPHGPATLSQNPYATPCTGVTYSPLSIGIAEYLQDFDLDLDGWGSNAPFGINGGMFTSTSPYTDDFNHTDIAGTLSLLAYHNGLDYQLLNNSWQCSDITGSRWMMNARWRSWTPYQSRLRPWVQARHPADPGLFANFEVNIPLDAYADGAWHVIDFTVTPDLMIYAGGTQPYYQPLDPVVALRNVHNIHLPAIRPNNTAAPTGYFDLDWFRLLLAV